MSGGDRDDRKDPWSEVILQLGAVLLLGYGFYVAPLQQLLHRKEDWILADLCVFTAFAIMFLAARMRRGRLRR